MVSESTRVKKVKNELGSSGGIIAYHPLDSIYPSTFRNISKGRRELAQTINYESMHEMWMAALTEANILAI